MKVRLPRLVRSTLIVIFAILLLVTAYLAAKIVNPGEAETMVPQYTYNQKANVAYRAYLLPNSLYTERSLAPGLVYVSQFVDYINTYLTYEFTGQRTAEIKGDYEIKAVVETADKESKKTIWQREFLLIPKTDFTGSGPLFTIEREMPLRINDYNAFVKKVADESKINSDSVRLMVRWNINIEAKTDSGIIRDQLMPTMIIPLGVRFFEVTGELNKSMPGAIERMIMAVPPVNRKVATLLTTLFTISAVLLMTSLLCTTDQRDVDPMQLKLKQILKTHADRLVAIDREIRAMTDQIMLVRSMEDLIKIADELGKPIIFEGKGSAAASFYVMDGNKVFTYEFGSRNDEPSSVDSMVTSRGLRSGVNRAESPRTGV